MNPDHQPPLVKRRKFNRFLLWTILGLLLLAALIAGLALYRLYTPNVSLVKDQAYFYIRTGSDFETVVRDLENQHLIKDIDAFRFVADLKKYPSRVKAGRYRIIRDMSNLDIVNLLRSGKQDPVRLIFNNIRNKSMLAGRIGRQLEVDSIRLLEWLNKPQLPDSMNFTKDDVLCLFIPNTYEMYWNTSADQFVQRMIREYKTYWTAQKKERAKNLGLTPVQVSILASIVEMETVKNDEKPAIAGVYLNRLKRDIPLEADPTVIFAMGDYSIKRLLKKDLEFDSPYNTYKYKGLPPGPITMPSISSIEAVLKAEKHNYLFFCAKEDFSGYHRFSTDFARHQVYARAYQRALDKARIRR